MSKYFCLGRFIELIKERYPKTAKLIICFDPRKSVEKTKYNQLQQHPYRIVVIDAEKKHTLDYSKLLEMCGSGDETDDTNDTYEIVVTMSEGKSKTINTNKNFQFLDVSTDLKKFVSTKDKKVIEYFPSQIISGVSSTTLFNDMIAKKKECLSIRNVCQDDFNDIEFV
jgi:hypothetical protein